MIRKKLQVILFALLAVMIGANQSFAQTNETGSIIGKVTDKSGSGLPGVTLEVRSANLQGTRTSVSDSRGDFRFSLLPPGSYGLTGTLTGFQVIQQSDITVGLNKTVTLEVNMSEAVSETLVVTAAAPVVDVTTSSTQTNVTAETMQTLPLPRNYVAAAQIAPGTQTDAQGTTFYGSTGLENQYVIDGLDTTGIRTGAEGKTLNFDFIQEVEVKTGGLPAEYGRLTGGEINAITKSGGNQFHGSLVGYDRPQATISDNKSFGQRSTTATTVGNQLHSAYDGGATLGGFFVKDRLWFFGAYDHVSTTNFSTRINKDLIAPGYQLSVGQSVPTTIKENLYSAKLTLRLNDQHSVGFSVIGDPRTTQGAIFPLSGTPSTFDGTIKNGGADYVGRYSGIFASSWIVNATAGRHNEQTKTGGFGTTVPIFIDRTVNPAQNSGGFSQFDSNSYKRTIGKLDIASYFPRNDLKFGGDFENEQANVNTYQGGAGQRIYKFKAKNGKIYYRHRYYVNDTAANFDRNDPSTWSIEVPLTASPKTKNYSAYIQDGVHVLPNLEVTGGVRWESQKIIGRTGAVSIDLKSNWAPRFGVVWDVANNGRSKLYSNYGRFYESIPQDINIRSFGGELLAFSYNLSPDAANYLPDPAGLKAAGITKKNALLGGATPVDPKLKGQYIDEFLLGYDYEVASNMVVGVKGTYRSLHHVIEDMLVPSTGNYFIANPGVGLGREAGFYNGGTVVTPTAHRSFKGVEVSARKRFSDNLQFYASYLWSRLEGNYDGTFQASTGQADPNINSAFDYADFIVDNVGKLSNDRTHQLKFDGAYHFSGGTLNGLDVGLSTHYASGVPLSAQGYSFAYSSWEYFLTKRGALGRGPSEYEADMHIGYPIPLGAGRLNLMFDVFNLLNLQRKIAVDQRYNLDSDPACAGIPDAACNGDGGLATLPNTVIAAYTIPNARATATNPSFLKAGTAFSAPRTFRFGVRYTF